MIEIPLTQGQVTIIDDDKYELVSQYRWYAKWYNDIQSYYAATNTYKPDGKRAMLYLHRLLLGLEFGNKLQGDHSSGNTLDNRMENLRIATNAENSRNKGKRSDNTSGYKGVTWEKRANAWRARIKASGVYKSLGYFKNKHDAARAYNKAALKYFGEFAVLNEIIEDEESNEE